MSTEVLGLVIPIACVNFDCWFYMRL